MNRQIKFRIWDKVNNKFLWFFSNDLFDTIFAQSHSDGPIIQARGKIFIRSNIDYEINQFTGLHDKNGKEIYEGDILNNPIQGNRIVEYGSPFLNYAGYMLVNKEGMRGTLSDSDKLYEIMGNIYENNELLNK